MNKNNRLWREALATGDGLFCLKHLIFPGSSYSQQGQPSYFQGYGGGWNLAPDKLPSAESGC